MRYHFYLALASFSSHEEAGPCLCGDQGLAAAKWKKPYDTFLSNKNRIYNCINDESSQKKIIMLIVSSRKRRGGMETDNVWVGVLFPVS